MLDQAAQDAILAYTIAGRTLNAQLRAGAMPAAARALDRAFGLVSPTTSPLVAWRGISRQFGETLVNGARLIDAGYLSLTSSERVARFYAGECGVVFRVEIAPGALLIVIHEHIVSDYPIEAELLAPRRTPVEILKIKHHSSRPMLVDARMELL